jgi:predicted nucleotidyltransferase
MRLSTAQRLALKQRLSDELGPDCEIRVFGSRTDDGGHGGDVDLLLVDPDTLLQSVHHAALRDGVVL